MDLFEQAQQGKWEPLAARMRPRTIDEFIGQEHIIGPGRLLRRAIQADQLSSIIFYGPPGTGKTTLAQVIANTTKSHFATMNAVLSGVKELRETITEAQERRNLYSRRTILFVDEVHRWNKSQQDALLPWVENGTVILVGATTENPFFEVNRALVSRSRIFQLKSLTDQNLQDVARQALADPVRGYGKIEVVLDSEALEHIIHVSNGDARSLLNALELAVETTAPVEREGRMVRHITPEIAEQSIQEKVVLYDKEGDYHFDVISAFIKSIRGSDPDAVLYWLAKMIQAGESPHFIFRRMLIAACEDIGLAEPQAIAVVNADAAAFDRIGLPEGRFHLAHAALYLATCPKSNSCMAVFDAIDTVMKEKEQEVPGHLRDASRDKTAFGHGEGYLYPHAYRDHWTAQQYLPTGLQGKVFYHPSDTGYEKTIKSDVERRREIQLAATGETETDEVLTFSPVNDASAEWLKRINTLRNRLLEETRDRIVKNLNWKRHYRVLDLNAGSGLLLWEAVRRVPEGGVWGVVQKAQERELLDHYSGRLGDLEKPTLQTCSPEEILSPNNLFDDKTLHFDIIMGRNVFTRLVNREEFTAGLFNLLEKNGQISFAEIIPSRSTRLSELAAAEPGTAGLTACLKTAEQILYSDPGNPLVNWDEKELLAAFRAAGFRELQPELVVYAEEKQIRNSDMEKWFDTHSPAVNYGTLLQQQMPAQELETAISRMNRLLLQKNVNWKREVLFLKGRKG